MKVLVVVNHPAHVHEFKNMIWNLERHGHTVNILAREKEMVFYLLDKYGFEYTPIGKSHGSTIGKAYELITTDYKCYKLAKKFRPDILVDVGAYGAHASKLIRKPSIIFNDDEQARLCNILHVPFASVLCNPSCYKKERGRKQVRFNSYKELAYLHPNYFKPDPSILNDLDLGKNDKFVILRFASWQAVHGAPNERGFDLEAKRKLVKVCERYARVFITSESPLPEELKNYQIQIPPERIHDALYYATMLIGDGGTMSAEAGVLGTPAVRYTSLVGPNDLGFLTELEQKYDLIYSFREFEPAMAKVREILGQSNPKQAWARKRERLLKDKIDLTAFMTWFVENYPESFRIMKKTPDYQQRFKDERGV